MVHFGRLRPCGSENVQLRWSVYFAHLSSGDSVPVKQTIGGLSNTYEWKKMENTGITFFFPLAGDPVRLENKISHLFCFQINVDKILSLAACDACVEEIGYSAPHDCGPVPFLIFTTTPWLLEVCHKGRWFNSSRFIGVDVPCFCRRIDCGCYVACFCHVLLYEVGKQHKNMKK